MDRDRFLYIARLLFSIGVLAVLIWLVDTGNLPSLEEINIFYVIATLAVAFTDRIVNVYRWKVLTNAIGVKVSFLDLFKIYFSSRFVGLVLPSSIGGELLKGYGLAKKTSETVDSASSVVAGRVFGLLALSVTCLFGYYITDSALQAIPMVVVIKNFSIVLVAGTLVSVTIGLSVPFGYISSGEKEGVFLGYVRKVWNSLHKYRSEGARLTAAVAISFFVQILRVLMVWLAGVSVGLDLEFSYFVMFVPFIQLGKLVPLTLSGVGIEEGAAVYLFSLVGVEAATVLSMYLLVRVLVIISVSPGAWIYFWEGITTKSEGRPSRGLAKEAAQ